MIPQNYIKLDDVQSVAANFDIDEATMEQQA